MLRENANLEHRICHLFLWLVLYNEYSFDLQEKTEEEEEEEALTQVIPKWKATKITSLTLWAPEEPPPLEQVPGQSLGFDDTTGSVLYSSPLL